MPDFIYPTNAELQTVAQVKTPRLTQDRLGFKLMPMRSVDASLLEWEQKDNYTGLQKVRGLNGQPTRVQRVGSKRYRMEPGYYGEFQAIDERELTTRRAFGSWNAPVNITDLVMDAQDHLLQRRLDRIETIIWTLLATGTFAVSDADGNVQHADAFPIQTYAALNTWSTVATATPLNDLRQVKLKHRGTSADFGPTAMGIMNLTTYNNMINNTNSADLYGRRTDGLGTFNNLQQINSLYAGDQLPQLVIYDETYFDEAGNTQLYVPNNKVIVIGSRPAGQPVAEYLMTRNANNPGMAAGSYMRILDRGEKEIPRTIEVHDGHNGGPAIYFPGAVVVMSV